MRLSIPYCFIIGILWIGACHSQDECATCRPRRRLIDFSKLFTSGKTVTVDQRDEIKRIMERAGHQVETVTQFTNLNSLLSERDVGLKAVSGAVDSISISLLGLMRDLVETVEAIPIIRLPARAMIAVFEAVDDVFYDTLDVVLVFLRDDVIGGIGADASVSSDARSVGLVNGDGFLDFFRPVETFVEGVEEAIGMLDGVIADPAAVQQAVLNATDLALERITPIAGPLAVLESIVSDTLTDITCVLNGEGSDASCRSANSTQRCNIDRLVCSAQNFFDGIQNPIESVGVATNTSDVTLNESNSTAAGVDTVQVETNKTELIVDSNATGITETQTETTPNATETEPVGV